jgi:hypothetical protein
VAGNGEAYRQSRRSPEGDRVTFQELDPYTGGSDLTDDELAERLEDDARVLEALKAARQRES